MKRNTLALFALAVLAFTAPGCKMLRARDNLNKGVQAYRNAQYAQAVEKFEQADQLDPTLPTARLHLAMAYYNQYIPGGESPVNQPIAGPPLPELDKVLQQE